MLTCSPVYVLWFFIVYLQIYTSTSTILGGFVMPHGGIALDPRYFNTTSELAKLEAWELHKACKTVGEEIGYLEPDVIFMSTPHGIADKKNFLLYLNSRGSGNADTDNCACPPCCYHLTVSMNSDLATELDEAFGTARNVSGTSRFCSYGLPKNCDEPMPLAWGEVIPLHFVRDLQSTQVVILSQPSRRYNEQVSMIPELLELGGDLYRYLEASPLKVVVVISADLAHTHLADGPYGFSPAAEPFDEACGVWAETMDVTSLLETAAGYVDDALSCGYTGMVMLQGMLAEAEWTPRLLVNKHPSYYGMMVASFIKNA